MESVHLCGTRLWGYWFGENTYIGLFPVANKVVTVSVHKDGATSQQTDVAFGSYSGWLWPWLWLWLWYSHSDTDGATSCHVTQMTTLTVLYFTPLSYSDADGATHSDTSRSLYHHRRIFHSATSHRQTGIFPSGYSCHLLGRTT